MGKNKFKGNLYQLVLKYNGRSVVVDIPKSKRGFSNKVVGGSSTYLMAIDEYTTRFRDKNELLDDIRNNGYARIKTIPNSSISVSIKYNKDNNPIDCSSIVYSDSNRLVEFINNNNIGNIFYFVGMRDGSYANRIINEFMSKSIELFYTSTYSDYYTRYLKNLDYISGYSLYNTLRMGYDKDYYERNHKIILNNPSAFYEYENIRRHLITDYKALEKDFAHQRYLESPYQERSEALKDYEEAISEIEERYRDKDIPLRVMFKDYRGPFTIDPCQEMDLLNKPFYEEDSDEKSSFRR